MGSAKEMLQERQEQEKQKRLAKKLGITYGELLKLNYDEDIDDYGFITIVFNTEDSPKHIFNKIKDKNGNMVRFLHSELD
ncbi:MAG: hypothetical protein FWC98_05545 [Bacteroidales bacterium]|nr:hypothetical protein [Bacteroidales bacterium]